MKHKSIFIVLCALFVVAMPSMAQMPKECMERHFIWSNFPLMYALDIAIIAAAVIAVYLGQRMLSSELKSVFMYIFAGMMLIALHYLLDLFSMLTNNMALMEFAYMDLFWILNIIAFILFVIGFYKMNMLFKKITKHSNERSK